MFSAYVEVVEVFLYASCLLCSVAVGTIYVACNLPVAHLQSCSCNGGFGSERQFRHLAYPVFRACADDDGLLPFGIERAYHVNGLRTDEVLACLREVVAQPVEVGFGHAAKEPCQQPLLGTPVGVEAQLHQYEEGTQAGQSREQSRGATHKPYQFYHGVGGGQRAVEVEGMYICLLHVVRVCISV